MSYHPLSICSRSQRARRGSRDRRSPSLEGLEDRYLLSFSAPVYYPAASSLRDTGPTLSVISGDFNGDKAPDLATSRSLLLNNGDGTFGSPKSHGGSGAAVAADFNRDGRLDLGATGAVLLGNGDGTFQPPLPHGMGGALTVGDFNGDAVPDLAGMGFTMIQVRLGRGDGTFAAAPSLPISSNPTAVASADFNGDGFTDLVVAHLIGSTVRAYLSNGDGTFRDSGTAAVTFPNFVTAADLNRDGAADLVTTSRANGSVNVLLGNGNGTFQTQQRYGYPGEPYGAAVADFNRDGIPDVAAADDYNRTVGVYLGNGNGTLRAAQVTALATRPYGVTAGDFNRDGHPDLTTGNLGKPRVAVLINRADWGRGPQGVPFLPQWGGGIRPSVPPADGVLAPVSTAAPATWSMGFEPAAAGDDAGASFVATPQRQARPTSPRLDAFSLDALFGQG